MGWENRMARDLTHDLMPQTDHDGMSRRLSVLALKKAMSKVILPAMARDFEAGRREGPNYKAWSTVNRWSQHQMWLTLAEQIDRDYDRIREAASKQEKKATVISSADFECPHYIRDADIHLQPGGYLLERFDSDLAAGLLYEMGGNLYALGQSIGKSDSKAQRIINFVRERFPNFSPRRIVELGCSAGAQTSNYVQAFERAKVFGVDVSAGLLNYAAARANALGVDITFHQADAAALPFEDNSVDLIVSHNLFHEVASDHVPAIMEECQRLLAPGGLAVHQDVAVQPQRLSPFMQFLSAWQKDNNGEPFWLDYAHRDFAKAAVAAGFDPENVEPLYLEQLDGPLEWFVMVTQA